MSLCVLLREDKNRNDIIRCTWCNVHVLLAQAQPTQMVCVHLVTCKMHSYILCHAYLHVDGICVWKAVLPSWTRFGAGARGSVLATATLPQGSHHPREGMLPGTQEGSQWQGLLGEYSHTNCLWYLQSRSLASSLLSGFDCLQYVKTEGECLVYLIMWMTSKGWGSSTERTYFVYTLFIRNKHYVLHFTNVRKCTSSAWTDTARNGHSFSRGDSSLSLGRHWHHWHDKMDQAFPLHVCIV